MARLRIFNQFTGQPVTDIEIDELISLVEAGYSWNDIQEMIETSTLVSDDESEVWDEK